MQMEGGDVFIYVTSPVMELRGGFRVGEVWAGTPQDIWEKVSGRAGVNRADFDAYYAGQSIAYALEITGVWKYSNPPGLGTLRKLFDNFVVPQSWRYVKPEEHRSFRSMERLRWKSRTVAKSLTALVVSKLHYATDASGRVIGLQGRTNGTKGRRIDTCPLIVT